MTDSTASPTEGATSRTDVAIRAFESGDAGASKAVHDSTNVTAATENHGGLGSDFVKSLIFGGLDGVITTFSTIASVAGGQLSIETAIVLGFANLIGDAIAMGAGDYLSSLAEFQFLLKEKERGGKMLEAGTAKTTVAAALTAKGLRAEDAAELMAIVSKPQYREFAEEFVLTEELGQEVPDDPLGPAKDGAVTMISFLVFGSLPLWVYVITWGVGYNNSGGSFGISAAACAMSLFSLGWLQGTITRQPRFKSAAFMTINGSLASAAAYFLGWAIMQAIGNGESC